MKTATTYVNYQQRASEFAVGDLALPFGADESIAGRVVAVYPAIGMIDLEFPHGSGRYPVEQIQRVTDIAAKPPATENDSVPGGTGTARVPGGPVVKQASTVEELEDEYRRWVTGDLDNHDLVVLDTKSTHRVAHAFLKKTLHKNALYWASTDRHYKATRSEQDGGCFNCPKCRETALKPARYKRVEGKTEQLLACPSCLFLIRKCDIIGHPDYVDDLAPAEPFDGIRLGSEFEEHLAELDDLLAEWDGTMDQGFDSVQEVV